MRPSRPHSRQLSTRESRSSMWRRAMAAIGRKNLSDAYSRAVALVSPCSVIGRSRVSEVGVRWVSTAGERDLAAIAHRSMHDAPPTMVDAYAATMRTASQLHIEGAIRSVREFDVARQLRDLSVPVLIVAGNRDHYGSLRHGLRITEALPRATVCMYDQVGHVPQWEAS